MQHKYGESILFDDTKMKITSQKEKKKEHFFNLEDVIMEV